MVGGYLGPSGLWVRPSVDPGQNCMVASSFTSVANGSMVEDRHIRGQPLGIGMNGP